jgi:hypothetical protein
MGESERQKRSSQIGRGELKTSLFAILIRASANVSWNGGGRYSLALSIPPKGAVAEVDDLVSSLMKTRGYPVSDFAPLTSLSTILE